MTGQAMIAVGAAVLLSGCTTVYTVTPLGVDAANLTWDHGQATVVSDKPLGAIQVRADGVGEKGRLVFEVAAHNKAGAAANFGYENISALDARGKSLRLYSRPVLEAEARSAAGWSRAGVALVATATIAGAKEATAVKTEKTVKDADGKEVKVTKVTYDPVAAEALREAALARADVEAAEIQRSLDARLAGLNDGHMLETTTVAPGGDYAGEVIAARPSGDAPDQAMTLQVTLNGEAHSFRFAVTPVR